MLYGTFSIGGGIEIEIVPYGSHVVGIDQPEDDAQTPKVYPNPGNGRYQIIWEEQHEIQYFLTDLEGKIILEGRERKSEFILDASLHPGIYLLHLKSPSHAHTLKIIQLH